MRLFTDNPLERLMIEVPRPRGGKTALDLPKLHPCYGCKRYGNHCFLPCYRGVERKRKP